MRPPPPVVLVVHPDEEARTTLYALLAQEGYAIATRSRAQDALEYIAKHRPESLLASTHLPDLGFKAFLGHLKEAGVDSNTIFLARHDDVELHAGSNGSSQVLAWPARPEDILAAVGRSSPTAA